MEMAGGVESCLATSVPLTPISFLPRAARVYGDKVSIVYSETVRFSWRETHQRCVKLASALVQFGISRGDVVAVVAPNIPAFYELHFAVPMAGAILSGLNPKLDASTLATKLKDLEAKFIFVDYQFVEIVQNATQLLDKSPIIVTIHECDKLTTSPEANNSHSGDLDYDSLLAMGKEDFEIIGPKDEFDPISVNFTSGSTGEPKGVLYSHRATYLNSLAAFFRYDMKESPVFLWTLDMFRCNGWCLPWTMAALGGTNICIRNLSPKVISDSIAFNKVTHLCGAPAVLNMIADAPTEIQTLVSTKIHVIIAGVVSTNRIGKVEALGFRISHGYGMTEVLGPLIVRPWKWDENDVIENYGEGMHNLFMEGVDVKDPETMRTVSADGKTLGEVMFKGNTLMTGYLKTPKMTLGAFKEGWYRTRDLAVIYPNGHIQLKDRAKDIIVSGGAIISTLEVEAVLLSHPKIAEAAVVGRRDEILKEKPCAFVKLKKGGGCGGTEEEIVGFCEKYLPGFMVPRTVVFGDLPVNSTGKVQKFVLRERANALLDKK